MLSCKELTENTTNYLDKNLSLYQRMQFKLHLMMCHNCRRFVDQFQLTVSAIKGLQPEPISKESVDKQVEELLKQRKK